VPEVGAGVLTELVAGVGAGILTEAITEPVGAGVSTRFLVKKALPSVRSKLA